MCLWYCTVSSLLFAQISFDVLVNHCLATQCRQTIHSLLSSLLLLLLSFWLTLIIAPCGMPLTFVHKWVAHAVDQATNNDNDNNYYLRLSHAPSPSLSVTHGAAWHSLTCCLNESDIMWHTFSTASPVIAFVCRAAYDGYCLPPAFCHLQAATGQHRPPAASSCHRLLNYSCKLPLPLQLPPVVGVNCKWVSLQ